MKKIYSLLAVCLLSMNAIMAANQVYAVFSTDGKRMTLYYDDQMDTRGGTKAWRNDSFSSKRANVTKIVINESMREARPEDMSYYFADFPALTWIEYLDNLRTDAATSFRAMFQNSPKLDLSQIIFYNFKTDNVTDFSQMFKGCSKTTGLDVSFFNTSNATDMSYMFYGCTNLYNPGGVKQFNTEKVTNFTSMFEGCESLGSLSIDNFVTTAATSFLRMFYGCKNLEEVDLSNFNTANVANMSYMFQDCEKLKELNIGHFETPKLKNARGTFKNCAKIKKLDMRKFDFSQVTYADEMFSGCSELKTILCNGDLTGANANNIFAGCLQLAGDNSTAFAASQTGREFAHLDGGAANPGYFSLNRQVYQTYEGNVLTFFYGNDQDAVGGDQYWDPYPQFISSLVTDVRFDASMDGCYPTSTKAWFAGMKKVVSLDIRKLHMESVKNVSRMFENCDKLTTIYCQDDWNKLSSITSSADLFAGSTKLRGSHSTPFDAAKVGIEYARPDKGESEPGYFWLDEQGIENVGAGTRQSQKRIQNGMLIIERNGKIYNALGSEIRD